MPGCRAWSCWGLQRGSGSSSSSVCTEDVAARCWEGTVGTSEEEDGSEQDGALLPWWSPWKDMSPRLMRRGSLESLGARISRLSQSGAETPCPPPSEHPVQGRVDTSRWGPTSGAKPSVTTLHGGDGDTGHPWKPSGSSAIRSRARAMGHPRWQELPAHRGWHGGDVTLPEDKEGDDDGKKRAHCTKAAVGPTGRCSLRTERQHEVSCPGHVTEPQWQRWKKKAVLSHRQGQKGCAGCPGKAWRKTLDLREEKRELQERIHGLQLQTRSVLRQRQEALGQLRAVLQKERMAALRQLQENLKKVNGAIRVYQEHCHLQEPAAPGALKEPLTPARAPQETATCSRDLAQPPHPGPSKPGLSHATGVQRCGECPCHCSVSSLSPSTVPDLQQHHRGVLRVLHHIQRCLRELQVEELGVLGTMTCEEVWGQPGTRDSATASPKGQIQA
ncbi:uncharacterized protein LOC136050086 [Cyrtonyx montezumae]|uniref:uncharacterized protein LOC136050086 n=1 Tax=Cyrtonyx montezumae TaxID=9017 RepID=UPI0032DA4589